SFSRIKWKGEYCRGRLNGNQLLPVKPQTYMNRSGECIRSFADYFNVSLDNILILHDDLDLPAGRIKVVARGGAGGHNGIRSIIQHLGSTDFARLKIGIGRPEMGEEGKGLPMERYVLAGFTEKELHDFHARLEFVIEAIELFIHEGVDFCMNRINGC
ncbi:MAG: aminoacyl-tRNA hydrolase, partial [Desulfobulbaceae bacterium]|nr:aminoacyl-tRNA hydrolase [Desulfobulbaceae bacterium]